MRTVDRNLSPAPTRSLPVPLHILPGLHQIRSARVRQAVDIRKFPDCNPFTIQVVSNPTKNCDSAISHARTRVPWEGCVYHCKSLAILEQSSAFH